MNHLKQCVRLTGVVAAFFCAASAGAEGNAAASVVTPVAPTAEEVRQLGGPVLTEFGAERAGNKEGTIPEYTGKGVKAPPTWDPKNPGQRPDPYGEKPLFTITAQNAAQYADKLDGMVELFKRYPNYRMDIYPSHRDWVFPKYVLDNIKSSFSAKNGLISRIATFEEDSGLPLNLANFVDYYHLDIRTIFSRASFSRLFVSSVVREDVE